jgi:hypothetical protein
MVALAFDDMGAFAVTLDLCLFQGARGNSGNAQKEHEEDRSHQAELIHLARVVMELVVVVVVVVVDVDIRNGKAL